LKNDLGSGSGKSFEDISVIPASNYPQVGDTIEGIDVVASLGYGTKSNWVFNKNCESLESEAGT
jgi:hypothetical protein